MKQLRCWLTVLCCFFRSHASRRFLKHEPPSYQPLRGALRWRESTFVMMMEVLSFLVASCYWKKRSPLLLSVRFSLLILLLLLFSPFLFLELSWCVFMRVRASQRSERFIFFPFFLFIIFLTHVVFVVRRVYFFSSSSMLVDVCLLLCCEQVFCVRSLAVSPSPSYTTPSYVLVEDLCLLQPAQGNLAVPPSPCSARSSPRC